MKNNFVLYLFILLFYACNCKENQQKSIHGIIINQFDSMPLSYYPLRIDYKYTKTGMSGACAYMYETVHIYTDSLGKFEYNFKVSAKYKGYSIVDSSENIILESEIGGNLDTLYISN